MLFFPPFLSFPRYKLFAYLCFGNSKGIYKCFSGSCMFCVIWASWRGQDWICIVLRLCGPETYQVMKSVKCGASFYWCCTLPCFEHHCGVNFFCILVYILMVVSLKENSWVRVWNFYMSCLISSWKAFEWWKCHTCNVFGDYVFFHSAVLYAWDHKIFPENLNCSVWYHITYFFPGPLCNYNKNSVWIA